MFRQALETKLNFDKVEIEEFISKFDGDEHKACLSLLDFNQSDVEKTKMGKNKHFFVKLEFPLRLTKLGWHVPEKLAASASIYEWVIITERSPYYAHQVFNCPFEECTRIFDVQGKTVEKDRLAYALVFRELTKKNSLTDVEVGEIFSCYGLSAAAIGDLTKVEPFGPDPLAGHALEDENPVSPPALLQAKLGPYGGNIVEKIRERQNMVNRLVRTRDDKGYCFANENHQFVELILGLVNKTF